VISKRLKDLRTERGLSVAELASRSGVSQPYIWQIESGRRKNPGSESLQKLAKALGVSVNDLLSAPATVQQADLESLPASLQEFTKKRGKALGVRREDLDMLRHISYRGRRPQNVDEWELIFLFLRRILKA